MKKLEHKLGLLAVVALSMSSMLGSGIFVLPGLASAQSGPSVWLAYVMAALCVLPAALSKAELAAAMPSSGGTYIYLDRAFGPFVGTIAGLGLWLSLLLKCAFALVGIGVYLSVIADVPVKLFACGLVALIVLLNIRGVRGVSGVQAVVTAISLAGLLALAGVGGFQFHQDHLAPAFPNGIGGFLNATGFVFVSFAGVTKVAAIAEEIDQPAKNLPRGILLSLAIVTVVYASVALILVGVLPAEQFAHDLKPVYSLAMALGGAPLGMVAAIVGVATLASMANAGVLAASRFPFAMARDDLLPPLLGRLHSRFLTPTTSIIVSGLVIVCAIVLLDVEKLAKTASAFMIMIYCSEGIAVIALRETHVQWYRPAFRSPLYPVTQVGGILLGIMLLVMMGMVAVAAGLAIGSAGVPLYLFYGRRRAKRMGVLSQRGKRSDLLNSIATSIKTLAEVHFGEQAAVVVALFGKERSPEMLVELGDALRDGGLLEVVHLTEIPEQTDLDAVDDDPSLLSVRRRIEAMAESQKIPLEFESIVTRDVVKTIDDISGRLHCQWLVLQWTGRDQMSFTIRNPIGWLRDHVPSNLAVFHDAGVRYIREILVYVEPERDDTLVMTTAVHLAAVYSARLTFARFVPDSAPLTMMQREADYLDQVRALSGTGAETLIVRGSHKAKAIGEATASFDLLVMAERQNENIWGRLRGTVSDRLTETAVTCSVLRLQSPRREGALLDIKTARAELRDLRLSSFFEQSCIALNLDVYDKEALFECVGHTFAAGIQGVVASDVVEALWERERLQNTAAGMGLALPHATVNGIGITHIGVFTSRQPIDYGAPDGRGVDIFFVTLGSPEERLPHIVVMSAISKVVAETELLTRLRNASSTSDVLDAIETNTAKTSLAG
ncbi:MAG: amino acid permease [Deltaproteobacteria bacterium]|nr:amino acid permease [Deltaproteobacteria bacterium]